MVAVVWAKYAALTKTTKGADMPRTPRSASQSGLYHVTMRGNAKADIFEADVHRQRFTELLSRYRDECRYELLAWCLMDNHVHLVIDANDMDLSGALQKLATAYAVYYNKNECRVGHLFQSPFRSRPIEYEEQLVNTVRYVHRNPERAGICAARDYKWSSYGEYAGEPWLVNKSMVMGIVNRVDELLEGEVEMGYVVHTSPRRTTLSDTQARAILAERLGVQSCVAIGGLPKKERNKVVQEASNLGLPIAQMARLFGLGERTVYRVVRNTSQALNAGMTPLKVSKGV